jgi:hypothetical protein
MASKADPAHSTPVLSDDPTEVNEVAALADLLMRILDRPE